MLCIRSINKTKAHPLNSRVFAKLCEKNNETADQLLMHTEVRWLSRGDSLQRLVDTFDSTVEFLGEVAPLLCHELNKCKKNLLYVADIYSKFNEIQNVCRAGMLQSFKHGHSCVSRCSLDCSKIHWIAEIINIFRI